MQAKKTDNKYFGDKVGLRMKFLPDLDEISVLDCFHGSGKIWGKLTELSDGKISVIGIDIKDGPGVLVGDNRKWLRSLDLERFDVIDLDAYGNPFDQIDILIDRKWHGCVFFTWIKINVGPWPRQVRMTSFRNPTPDVAMGLIGHYFNSIGINGYNYILKKRAGGFNLYGQFYM
jgi:hypothetical protein